MLGPTSTGHNNLNLTHVTTLDVEEHISIETNDIPQETLNISTQKPIDDTSASPDDIDAFLKLSPHILDLFESRATEEGTISLPPSYGDLTFREENGGVFIIWKGKSSFQPNKSIHNLHNELAGAIISDIQSFPREAFPKAAEHIVSHVDNFSERCVVKAAQYIMNSMQDFSDKAITCAADLVIREPQNYTPEVIKYTLFRILSNPNDFSPQMVMHSAHQILKVRQNFVTELVTKAAQYVINHSQDSTEEFTSLASYQLVRVTDCGKKMSVKDSAIHIMSHVKDYPNDSVKSAATCIVVNSASYSHELINIATKHIKNNCEFFASEIIKCAAKIVITNNLTFFETASRYQSTFKKFFNEEEQELFLKPYSTELGNILQSDTRKITHNAEQIISGRCVVIPQKLSLLSAWLSGLFMQVVEMNNEVAMFILKNMEHDVITLWNSKKGVLINSTIM